MLRITAGCETQTCNLFEIRPQFLRRLVDRHCVEIHDAENTFVIVLDLDPVAERAQIISDVQITGRLDAREYACFHDLSGTGILPVRGLDSTTKQAVFLS